MSEDLINRIKIWNEIKYPNDNETRTFEVISSFKNRKPRITPNIGIK